MTTDAGVPGAPRFDVVLRGYDRRQVDEHVARLQRVVSRMRADLEMARSQPIPLVQPPSVGLPAPGQQVPPGARPRPTPRPRPGGPMPPGQSPDMINNFTDRMQSILQAAEDEAAEIRKKARSAARAEEENVRAQLADLVRQRDAVLAELTRMRGQLEGMLAAPTARITLPPRDSSPAPTRPRDTPAPAPSLPGAPGQHGVPQPAPAPSGGSPSSSGTRASGAGSPGPSTRAAESSAQGPRPGSTGSTPDGSQADSSRPGQGGSSHPGPGTAGPHGGGGQGGSPRSGSTSASSGPGASAPAPNRSARPDVPAPKPTAAPPAQSASTAHHPGDSHASSSASGRPSSGTSSPPKPSPGGDQSSAPASKSAAHRLPSGGYQAVGEQSGSMRPRAESDPEPADLFRPVAGEADEPQSTGAPRAGGVPSGDRTTLVPVVRPADRSTPVAETDRPAGKAGAVDTTVKVNSVRSSSGSEATSLTPPVTPASGGANQKNPTSGGTDDGVRGDGGAGAGPGPSGSDWSNRPTSASRSG
ncbi:hypothetical protein [Pseudonocardia sp.]|uniref:hypothetical protein n=1 Tax=Pseudonocardia sp. TaxID=60912 RepID=UPI0031FC2903